MPEAENQKILKTAQLVQDEGFAYPILLGDPKNIAKIASENGIDLEGIPVIDPKGDEAEGKTSSIQRVIFLQETATTEGI